MDRSQASMVNPRKKVLLKEGEKVFITFSPKDVVSIQLKE